jgi:hypothetical protein
LSRAQAATERVVAKTVGSGRNIHGTILAGPKPSTTLPHSSLSKVPTKLLRSAGRKERALTVSAVSTVEAFAQTLRMGARRDRKEGPRKHPREVPALTARETR